MKKFFTEETLKVVLRIGLGLVFILSGISKLINPENFIQEVDKINLLSTALTKPIVYLFIIFELTLAFFILFKPNNKVFIVTMVLMAIFCCYLGYKIIIHDTSDCGCFGNFIYRSNLSALIQDIFLLMMAVYLYDYKKNE